MSANVRKLGLALCVGTVLVAIAATQYPFHYQLTRYAIHYRWVHRVDWRWFPNLRHGHLRLMDRDFVLNLLMLLPLGIGYALWRRAPAWRVVLEALLLGAVVAIGLELAQLLTPWRTTSLADAWRNTVSCFAGALFVVATSRLRPPPSRYP